MEEVLITEGAARVNRRAFFDGSVFEREIDKIFNRSWQFVAHESEIRESGDYVTRFLAMDPVIVTRSDTGEVHVLHNSCRHRGAQLCGADGGNTSHFRCSYHGWTYTSTGELRGIPQRAELYAEGFDRCKHSLRSARVETFCGLVFATFDATLPPLQEYLGEVAFYIKAVFGKCEMEVMGPPTRRVGTHNWKTGVENWTGDGYHNEVTHKSVRDLQMNDPGPVVAQVAGQGGGEPIWDSSGKKQLVYQFATKNGHAGKVNQLAASYEKPVYFGYEPHLWPTFNERLEPAEIDVASRCFQLMTTVFPNFSFTQLVFAHVGDDTPPTCYVTMRIWRPISATETENIFWVVVPRDASAKWKTDSQRAFTRSLGVAGILDVDDMQNWKGMTQANLGPLGLEAFHDYSGKPEEPTKDTKWPGRVYPGVLHDVVFRSLYAEWARRLQAA